MEISYVTQIAEESCVGSVIETGLRSAENGGLAIACLSYLPMSRAIFFSEAYDASQYLVGYYERT